MLGAIYAGVVALIVVNELPALVNVIAVVTMFPSRRLGVVLPLALSTLVSVASVGVMPKFWGSAAWC
jgi:hypothetical protein